MHIYRPPVYSRSNDHKFNLLCAYIDNLIISIPTSTAVTKNQKTNLKGVDNTAHESK